MKTTISVILTTLVGGMPVSKDYSKRTLNKLLVKNRELNSNLPFVSEAYETEEELVEANRLAKKQAILESCPRLKEIEYDIDYASARLSDELKISDGKISEDYKLVAKYILALAESKVGTDTLKLYFKTPDIA